MAKICYQNGLRVQSVQHMEKGGEPVEVPGQERFPRSERLTKRSEFLDVYEHGEKTVGRAFICYVVRHEGSGRKFGVAVTRKVGNAVVRNKVKRAIREVYRSFRKNLLDDVTIVIVARPVAASLNFHECNEAIARLFQKGGTISE